MSFLFGDHKEDMAEGHSEAPHERRKPHFLQAVHLLGLQEQHLHIRRWPLYSHSVVSLASHGTLLSNSVDKGMFLGSSKQLHE